MRRYSLLALAVALLFAMGMMAQTSSGSSPSASPYPGSGDRTNSTQTDQSGAYGSQTGNPANQQPGMGTAGQRQSGTYGTQTDSSQNGSYGSQTGTSQADTGRKAKEKTIEGCVVRQETDYYIFPKNGQAERISSSGQGVSEHLGHHVKLHGTEQPASNTSASSTTGGTSGTAGTSTSANTGANTGGAYGSVGANTGASNTAGTSGAASNKEFIVDRVDMVSETCPANIQSKATSSGMSTSPR